MHTPPYVLLFTMIKLLYSILLRRSHNLNALDSELMQHFWLAFLPIRRSITFWSIKFNTWNPKRKIIHLIFQFSLHTNH